ncbi:hypothetical protein LCGC14_0417030 [marine sediment metagenome]|uniref:HNH nuclease domain-containing protein n=1 Tax=marine sediment metagenome TaxID=412755 RepID=A0A0F9SY58_9ZZZZ
MKCGKPLKKTLLKRGKGINPISPEQKQINIEWDALVGYLAENRADWECEIPCGGRYNLQGHHIIKRSQGGLHNAGNCLIACHDCHRHDKWGPGIPIPAEEALVLVAGLNKKYNIDGEMTGADVLRMTKGAN